MEFPDLKIEPIAKLLRDLIFDKGSDMESYNIEVWFIIVALFLISFNWRWFGRKLDANIERGTQRLKDLDRTTEENTDAQIETAREVKALRRQISRITLNIENKNLKIERRYDDDDIV